MAQGGNEERIGALNGKWSFLLKAVLLTTPAFWAIFVTVDLPWRIWVTKSVFDTSQHEHRAEECMAKIDRFMTEHLEDHKRLEERVDALPPKEWKDRIYALENYERENKSDHTKILVSLEAIRAQLLLNQQEIRNRHNEDDAGGTNPGAKTNETAYRGSYAANDDGD